jgi:hypothetical protein
MPGHCHSDCQTGPLGEHNPRGSTSADKKEADMAKGRHITGRDESPAYRFDRCASCLLHRRAVATRPNDSSVVRSGYRDCIGIPRPAGNTKKEATRQDRTPPFEQKQPSDCGLVSQHFCAGKKTARSRASNLSLPIPKFLGCKSLSRPQGFLEQDARFSAAREGLRESGVHRQPGRSAMFFFVTTLRLAG